MPGHIEVGLELDGSRATVVSVSDGVVAAIRSFDQDTPESALAAALASIRAHDPVRAVLLTEGVAARRVDVTGAALTSTVFRDLALSATGSPREGTTTAGLLFDVDRIRAGLLGSGLAAAAPAGPVAAMYAALGRRPSQVVPAVFTASPLEGVSLALRHAGADLVLVLDGAPVAFASLPTGGLAVVEAALGGGTGIGRERLAAALAGNAALDPIATGELERYLRRVLVDVRDTLTEWARRGERVSRELFIHGAGARARVLDVLLADAALTRVDHPDVMRALVSLDPADRPTAVTAYLAALSYGNGAPYSAFPDPRAVRAHEAAARRARRRKRVRTLGAAALIVAAGAGGPQAVSTVANALAQNQLQDAQNELKAAGPAGQAAADQSVLTAARKQLAHPGMWRKLLTELSQSAPSGVRVGAVSAQARGDDLLVTVNGTASRADTTQLQAYTTTLTAKLGARGIVPGTVTRDEQGHTTFTVTFTLPGGAR